MSRGPSGRSNVPLSEGKMSEIFTKWQQGKTSEIHFWNTVISGTEIYPDFHQDLLDRANPNRPLLPWLPKFITVPSVENARILDVGAGPITVIGWVHDGKRPQITPIDAFAFEYGNILREHNIFPPVRTQQCN